MKKLTKVQKGILKAVIDYYGEAEQMEIVVEECAELIDAIKKYKRGRCTSAIVIEEMVDVFIMLNQLEIIFTSCESCKYDEVFEEYFGTKIDKIKEIVNFKNQ